MKKRINKLLIVATLTLVGCEQQQLRFPTIGTENEHEWVDLGLSVCWATTNIGADTPEQYGNYYAWGEIAPKEKYTIDNYKWYNGTDYTKYNAINNTISPDDDAAHVNWGGKWRLPTQKEIEDLFIHNTWKWTTRNGINGCEVTSGRGSSIFLPAAGLKENSETKNTGGLGLYWSSQNKSGSQNISCCLTASDSHTVAGKDRYNGIPIRPVCPK